MDPSGLKGGDASNCTPTAWDPSEQNTAAGLQAWVGKGGDANNNGNGGEVLIEKLD
jgi:hypothetical protein